MLNLSLFLESIHENANPAYLQQKEEKKKLIQSMGLISTAVLVASAVVGIFGIALTLSGGVGAVMGLPLILVNLPLGYLSFNAYKVSQNINDIIDNPAIYRNLNQTFDKQKIKKKLEKETFFFNWIIDVLVDKYVTA